jgi:phage terminase large subunit-like protein
LVIAVGVDLAISKRNTADKTAIAVWGLTDKRERVLLYVDSGRWSPEETKQKILEVFFAFKPVKIRVENVAFQDMLRQELDNDEMPIEGFHTSGTKKYSEETGLAHIAMLLEQGKVILPSGKQNKDYYKRVMSLLYQMSVYTDDQHAGDELMASWFAIGVLREFDAKLKENKGFFSSNSLVEHLKTITASRKIFLIGNNPPIFRFANNSLLHIFRPVEGSYDYNSQGKPFFAKEERFMIFATRAERSVAYIFEKHSSEIVGKIEGNLTALSWVTLLEKTGRFFNNAQIVHDRNNEGQAIYMELQKRNYPNLLCMQPDKDGFTTVGEGFMISESNLPIAVDYFKGLVDGVHIKISDDLLLNEMAELISVEGDKLVTSFGSGQRIKTVATGLWLLDNYETKSKNVYNGEERPKKKKELRPHYRVFQYKNHGRN